MDAGDVEEYLEEKLFGSKEPVSSTLLSFELGHTLAEAAGALQSFYDSHRDVLDASFKVRTKEDARISIKVVKAEDLDKYGAEKGQIWIVSPQGAADKVVIATVSAKVQQLQCGLSIGRLKYLGLSTNPLLESDFTISEGASQPSFHGQTSNTKQPSPPITTRTAKETTPQTSNMPSNVTVDKTKPASNKPEPSPKRAKTEEHKKKSEIPTPRQQLKSSSPFFTTTNKADALKSMHKKSPESKPVHEAVVISDEPNDQTADDGSEADNISKASREEQLRKLKEDMFKDESSGEEDIPDRDEELGDHMDVDTGPDEMDNDMDDAPLEARDAERENISQAPEDSDGSREGNASKSSADNNFERAATEQRISQRPQTRRVRKVIVRKDEEGFDVHEEIWEDAPIDSAEATPETPVEQQKDSKVKKETEAKADSDVKKTAKAPPKLSAGPKKQKTLMSFFGKK